MTTKINPKSSLAKLSTDEQLKIIKGLKNSYHNLGITDLHHILLESKLTIDYSPTRKHIIDSFSNSQIEDIPLPDWITSQNLRPLLQLIPKLNPFEARHPYTIIRHGSKFYIIHTQYIIGVVDKSVVDQIIQDNTTTLDQINHILDDKHWYMVHLSYIPNDNDRTIEPNADGKLCLIDSRGIVRISNDKNTFDTLEEAIDYYFTVIKVDEIVPFFAAHTSHSPFIIMDAALLAEKDFNKEKESTMRNTSLTAEERSKTIFNMKKAARKEIDQIRKSHIQPEIERLKADEHDALQNMKINHIFDVFNRDITTLFYKRDNDKEFSSFQKTLIPMKEGGKNKKKSAKRKSNKKTKSRKYKHTI